MQAMRNETTTRTPAPRALNMACTSGEARRAGIRVAQEQKGEAQMIETTRFLANGKPDTTHFPKDRLTFVNWPAEPQYSMGPSVTVYLGSVSLGNYDTQGEAEREARFIISAFDNGARWARNEFPGLALD
jgi:hypothetical protein